MTTLGDKLTALFKDTKRQTAFTAALWDTNLLEAAIGVVMKQMSAHALLSCTKPGQFQTRAIKTDLGNQESPFGTCDGPFTHPHGKHAWTVREGTLIFEKIEVHLADVVLQVKCCGKVGLTVPPGANQHRLVGSMDPLVPTQQIHFLEHLLTCLTRVPGCKEVDQIQTGAPLL